MWQAGITIEDLLKARDGLTKPQYEAIGLDDLKGRQRFFTSHKALIRENDSAFALAAETALEASTWLNLRLPPMEKEVAIATEALRLRLERQREEKE